MEGKGERRKADTNINGSRGIEKREKQAKGGLFVFLLASTEYHTYAYYLFLSSFLPARLLAFACLYMIFLIHTLCVLFQDVLSLIAVLFCSLCVWVSPSPVLRC